MVLVLLPALLGCGSNRKYTDVEDVKVYYLSEKGGLVHRTLTSSKARELRLCLLQSTVRIPPEKREEELLPTTFLFEVTTNTATSSIELISRNNLADNEGIYFNDCAWNIVRYEEATTEGVEGGEATP